MDDNKEKPQKKSRLWLKISLIVLGSILLLSGISFFVIYIFSSLHTMYSKTQSEAQAYVNVVKDASAQVSYAREAKNRTDAINAVSLGVKTVSTEFPKNIYPYAIVISDWGNKVSKAANSGNASNSPEAPEPFTMSLSDREALDVYKDALADIDNLKTFGDYSLAKKNQDEMRWIAARLQAEQILLDGLNDVTITDSKSKTNIAHAATKYGSTCYYGRGMVLVFSKIKKGDCLKKLSKGIDPVRKAAQEYASGKAEDANNWNAGWNEIKGIGYPISTVGVTVGDDNFATPPAIAAFQNACKAKGGNSPAGAAMDRLPTSESGLICTYKGPKGGFCWDFQTNSGKPYSGGDGDCPHLNLLPVINPVTNPQPDNSASVEQPANIQPETNQANFDGTYSGAGSADGGLTNVTVTISGNKISGSATYAGIENAQIGVSITGSVNTDGGVSGNLSGSGSIAGWDVSGNGTFTGQISGTTINVNYTVTGSGAGKSETHSGTLVLNK